MAPNTRLALPEHGQRQVIVMCTHTSGCSVDLAALRGVTSPGKSLFQNTLVPAAVSGTHLPPGQQVTPALRVSMLKIGQVLHPTQAYSQRQVPPEGKVPSRRQIAHRPAKAVTVGTVDSPIQSCGGSPADPGNLGLSQCPRSNKSGSNRSQIGTKSAFVTIIDRSQLVANHFQWQEPNAHASHGPRI